MRWFKALFGAIVISSILSVNSYAQFYTVKSGDSLIRISKKLGFNPYAIKILNPNTKWLKIRPGDKIKIPSKNTAEKSKQETSSKNQVSGIYIVKSGDSLIKIAKKFKIKPALIKKCNPKVKWLKIRPGDKIDLPLPQKSAELKKQPGKYLYIVRKNDSLIKISKRINISIKEIKRLNPDIDWSKIQPNNTIKLPPHNNTSAREHGAKAAENTETTVKTSPKREVGKMKKRNIITSARLKKELISRKCSLKPGYIGDGYYIVKSGDTLISIAHRFGLTLKQLTRLNPNKSRFIMPGDLIVIPGELTDKIMLSEKEKLYIPPKYLVYSTPYKIKRGDTLYKIAKKFKTKVYVIKMLNNLSSNVLRAGSYVFVPNKNMLQSSKLEIQYSLLKERRKALVHYAERFLGKPYRFGGTSLAHGIDCSAFVQKIYRRFIKMRIPRTAEEQYRTVGVFVPLSKIRVGDLLFFHTMSYAKVTHVGIYIGNNRFIHAAGRRSGIKISKLTRYYLRRLVGVKRILSISNKYAYFRHRPG